MTRDGSQGSRGRRIFSAEFKQEAVRRMRERRAAGVTLAHISRELEVSADQLRAWTRELDANAETALTDVFPGQGRVPSGAEELRRLQREVQRLQQENAFLKDAAVFFAKGAR
ncbi:MAG TPA: transposase [Gemmatimonadaceae bacterium]|nr:transposase [Gemmatimonadaceae bacterium]